MAIIKVKAGTVGFYDARKVHTTKSVNDAPFECGDQQAAYFVNMGVAEYVNTPEQAEEEAPASQDEAQQEEQPAEAQKTKKLTGHLAEDDLETRDYNELKKLAADMGVKPAGQKKADYIAALAAVELEIDDEEDPDELPELTAADPE